MGALYQEYPPVARLEPFVECFWMFQSSRPLTEYPVMPDGCIDIVYSPSLSRDVQLIGAMTSARKFALPAGDLQFGARFKPAMARAFLPMAALDTTDQSIALSDIWGADARRLTEQIAETQSVEKRIGLLEARLGHSGEITLVQRLCASIVNHLGQVGIDDLAVQAGLSARQLRRLFLEQVGLSPKHFCRIIRFRNSLSRLRQSGRGDSAQLALDCGYYDQAHFNNEFRQFSGYTPLEFAALER